MINSIIFSVFGVYFIKRISTWMFEISLFDQKYLKMILLIQIFLIFILIWFLNLKTLIIFFLFLVILSFPLVFIVFFIKYQYSKYKEEAVQLIEELILEAKINGSLKSALVLYSKGIEFKSRYLQELVLTLLNKNLRPTNKEVEKMAEELNRIISEPLNALTKLDLKKNQLKLQISFENKIKKVSLQSKAQAIASLLIYVSLFFYILFSFGFETIFIYSAIVFLVGFFITFNIGRGYKWKN